MWWFRVVGFKVSVLWGFGLRISGSRQAARVCDDAMRQQPQPSYQVVFPCKHLAIPMRGRFATKNERENGTE